MKLYATITSERATKGQGGNEFIRIDLLGGSKVNPVDMGQIEMRMMNDDKYCQLVHYPPGNDPKIIFINSPKYNEKGNKQKGKFCSCGRGLTEAEAQKYDGKCIPCTENR